MLQNEGLDGKKKQYVTCALDSTSPKEGGGGSQVGYLLAVSHLPLKISKSIFWADKFLLLFLIPGKRCWFWCLNLGFLQFVGSLGCVWQ